MIGLGVVTYNRPDYFAQCLAGVTAHLLDEADVICVYNDGSTPEHRPAYQRAYRDLPDKIAVIHADENHGVAHAKNTLLQRMMAAGCDALFLLEDDIVPQSPEAIRGYVRAARKSGYQHFNFAYHAEDLTGVHPFLRTKYVSFFYSCIGAYSFYTRQAIERVGYMDEHFINAYEHVEHTVRIIRAGLTAPFGSFADATGAPHWLRQIPGSLQQSAIRVRPDWAARMADALAYWKQKDGIGFPPYPRRIVRLAQIFAQCPKCCGVVPRILLP